jgi:integrase/recombinase XerC
MSSTMKWPDTIAAYIRDQRQFGRCNSENTARAYLATLNIHHKDIRGRSPLRTDREDVKRTLARWHGNSQYNRHSVLISFYDWLMQEGHRTDNPARQVRRSKVTRPSVYRLTRAEAAAMMDACESVRDRRAIYIGLLTGARVTELANLQIRHLERPGWVWFSEDIAKGHKERWVPVLPELAPIIEETIGALSPLAFVVPTRLQRVARERGKASEPISRAMLSRIIKDVGVKAGIAANIHPHLLRHSFGDHIAKHAGLRVAQALMGHESVETTARVYVDRPDLDELALHVQDFWYRGDAVPAVAGPVPVAPSGVDEAWQALEAYAERRDTTQDTRIIAELAPLIDQARTAGMDMDMIAALACGKEAV